MVYRVVLFNTAWSRHKSIFFSYFNPKRHRNHRSGFKKFNQLSPSSVLSPQNWSSGPILGAQDRWTNEWDPDRISTTILLRTIANSSRYSSYSPHLFRWTKATSGVLFKSWDTPTVIMRRSVRLSALDGIRVNSAATVFLELKIRDGFVFSLLCSRRS